MIKKNFYSSSSSLSIPFFVKIFSGVPHLATCIFFSFYNEPELGPRINTGMALTPFPSIILDETRFEPTTF